MLSQLALIPAHPTPPAHAATCPEGFAGPSCALCQTDAACAASTGTAATCSTQLGFSPSSALKSYACSLPSEGLLGGLLEPGSLLVQCATGSKNCTIGFTVKSGGVAVGCEATACTLADGQASLTCGATKCSCPKDTTCGNSSESAWARVQVAACVTRSAIG